uniref:hypothetical protein n=1 Tax=Helicobacter typhlonius TaxID=76936 RepID=UPI002FE02BBD
MNAQKYLEDMYKIQDNLLDYLDDEEKDQEKFQSLISILDQMNIHNNQHDAKLILHLLLQISNNHHRNIYFMSKIFEILQYF